MSDSLHPMDYIVHGILQARILEWVTFPFSRGRSQLGIEPRSPALQEDSLQAEPQGKPNIFIYMFVCVYMCVCVYIYKIWNITQP